MPTPERLAEQFEAHRSHVRAVAYRMLGSVSEAEDAVQEAWIRLSRADVSGVDNLRGWLTTVVARVCLDMLRTRTSRREDPLDVHVPDPIIARADGRDAGPEADAMLADSVGLALLVVLEKLEPAERLAFVLHDVFGMAFEEIAPIVDRSSWPRASSRAARAGGSRASADLGGGPAETAPGRRGVSRRRSDGDFEALVAVLDPEIVLRADGGAAKGCRACARGPGGGGTGRGVLEARVVQSVVLVNGNIGVVSRLPDGRVLSVIGFTIAGGKVVEMDILADPDRLTRLDLSAIEG
jgi:RNA polymerase sigma-70 factor (ECF subfamily)